MDAVIPSLDALIGSVTRTARDPLQRVSESMSVAGELGLIADHLVGHFVDEARAVGATWAEIGEALGVSKQAAQKRFVSQDAVGARQSLFARFDDAARSVVLRAQYHGRAHGEVNTGHIVLALVEQPQGTTGDVLRAMGVSRDQVKDAMLSELGPDQAGSADDHVPFAPDAKKVLQLALREALRLQDGHIGEDHLLLGLLRDKKSLGAATLARFGIDYMCATAILSR